MFSSVLHQACNHGLEEMMTVYLRYCQIPAWQDKQGQLQSWVEIVVEDFKLVETNKAAQTGEAEDEQLVQATLDSAMEEAEVAEDEPPIGKSRSTKPAKSDKALRNLSLDRTLFPVYHAEAGKRPVVSQLEWRRKVVERPSSQIANW
jgi:hypothetical protein